MNLFTYFYGTLDSLENLKSPIQISTVFGIEIIYYSNDTIYIHNNDKILMTNPSTVTLKDCLKLITRQEIKTIGGFGYGTFPNPIQNIDNIYLEKTIADLLSVNCSYKIYLEGSIEFFYHYILTAKQMKLNEDEQSKLFEEYKMRILLDNI